MSLDHFYSRAGHLIRRANQIANALFLEETASLDLTTVQYAALHMINEVPDIDQVTLSSMIAFDKTTLVKVLDRLVEKGLITRTQSKADRRRQLLNVTSQGRQTVKQVIPMLDRSERRILAPLSAADQRKFMQMLTQVVSVNNIYSRAPLDSDAVASRSKISDQARPRRKSKGG